MARKRYSVPSEEQERLNRLVRSGKSSARIVARARILLKLDQGWNAPQVAAALDVSEATVYRIKQRYAEDGLDDVLRDRPQVNRFRKLDDKGEAHLIALACPPAPEGHDHWTLQLLADQMVQLGLVESLSYETVRLKLKKTSSSPGKSSSGAFPRWAGNSWRPWRMCWTSMPNPMTPTGQWCASTRRPPSFWPMCARRCPCSRGRPRREDYEYRRAGVRNIFLTCEPLAGWRHVAITQRRTMADVAYPQASVLPVVLDNSNIHRPASLYETFPPTEARRIVKRLEFHYTPKHASWLNMAEIEFGVLTRACLKGRHADEGSLARSIRACQNRRNAARATIGWRFGTQDARSKLHRLYPRHSKIDWTLEAIPRTVE